MSTSIRQLLDEVTAHGTAALPPDRGPQVVIAARQTVGAAATALRCLQAWRDDWHPGIAVRDLSDALTESCTAVQDGNPPGKLARPAQLMAICADAIGTTCTDATPAADRWAVATAVADVVRRYVAVDAAAGPVLVDRHVQQAGEQALKILLTGRQHLPLTGRCLLDMPIPAPSSALQDPLPAAAAAAAEIDYRLARAASQDQPAIAVYELRAVALAFSAATSLAGDLLPDSSADAAQAWNTVHQLARQMVDGWRPTEAGSEPMLGLAAQLHTHLTRHQPAGPASASEAALLRAIADHAASSAASLIKHTSRMAGAVYTYAHRFPVGEWRITEHLHRKPFILRGGDLDVLDAALSAAAIASAQLCDAPADSWSLGTYPVTELIQPIPTVGPSLAPPHI
jgi:hypothetical protein